MTIRAITTLLVFFALMQVGAAQTPPAGAAVSENTGPNTNISRWARGTYDYRTITDNRLRGTESWQLFVYQDGSRTMIMSHDLFATNTQFTGLMRVDKDLKPLEAFAQFFTQGKFKGSAAITFKDGQMELLSTGQEGQVRQTRSTPKAFSISLHPIASDWWHYWYYDRKTKGSQISRYYSLEAGRDVGLPVTARLIETEQAEAGEEDVRVPAGTFKAIKFTSGNSAAWLTGPDLMLVKSISPKPDREYVLTTYISGP